MADLDIRTQTGPRGSALDRSTAMRLAADEYARLAAAAASFSPDEWSRPTCCQPWNVRDLLGHCLGMAQMAASVPETLRQQVTASRRAKRAGGPVIDALTDLQVAKNAGLSASDLVAQLREVGPKAMAGRRRTPGLVRRMPSKQIVDGCTETWSMGFLLDTILTRDPWMHRSDLAEATNRPMDVTAEHDGAIVDDVVREWAGRHGRPYTLRLTGPAGGDWAAGSNGESIEMDAVAFCRVLSGRGSGDGLLRVQVPF